VLSAEPVLTEEIAGLARAVADRYGGTMADVLRLAIPPRHAAVEAASADQEWPPAAAARPAVADRPGPWESYRTGPAFLAAIAEGRSPRALWSALPGPDWPAQIATAVAAAAAAGRGAVIVVPDARDLELVEAALAVTVGTSSFVSLSAQLG